MAATGPAAIIPAPPLTPPPNGLLNSATVIDHTTDAADMRWANGAQFAPESCQAPTAFDPCSTTSLTKSAITDAATTNASPVVTSPTANFGANDIGITVTGAGIPGSTTIISVQSATQVTLSANATATANPVTLTLVNRLPVRNRQAALTFLPFGLDFYDECDTFGFEAAEYEARARRVLAAQESAGVEAEFWVGAIQGTTNKHLQDNTNTTKLAAGAAQGLRTGLQLLVQAIADARAGRGMIHARPSIITAWSSQNLLRWEAGKLYTYAGNLVVPGYGYPGTAPDGTAPTTTSEWAYATGGVIVHRGPVEVFAPENNRSQSVDYQRNIVTTRAQRLYLYAYNSCLTAGVNINPTQTG